MSERQNPPSDRPGDKAPENRPEEKRPHRATSQGFRDQRASALNAALRENLRRRKQAAQANDGDISPESAAADGAHENAMGDGSSR